MMSHRTLLLPVAIVLAGFLCQLSAIKIISGPYLQNIGQTEATLMWRTDKPATARVEIAPDDSSHFYSCARDAHYATDLGRAVIGKIHKVTIKGLTPGTTYRYRIISEEVVDQQPYHVTFGKIAATNVFRKAPLKFHTRPTESETVDFTMVNDIHGDTARLSSMLESLDKSSTDFILYNGDMVNYMDKEESLFAGFIDKSVSIFASEIPFIMSRGNHETRGNWAKEYMRYFPTPTGYPYFAFQQGPVYFIVLDGGEDKPDSDIEYSGTSFFDDYRIEQAKWLQSITQSDAFRNSPFKIAIIHVPPVNNKWHGPLHTKELFLPLLNEAGIDLMLCGHLHRHIYNAPGYDGAQFPILINSNKHTAHIHADRNEINLTIKTETGEIFKKLIYHRKKN